MKILSIIVEIIVAIFRALFELLAIGLRLSIKGSNRQKNPHKAQFNSVNTIAKKRFQGFSVTGSNSLDIDTSSMNMLVVGQSGSGKSSTTLIGSILSIAKGGNSIVIHDPAKELHRSTARILHWIFGYRVLVLDFANSQNSSGYNPYHQQMSTSELAKLSTILNKSTGNNHSDPFWENMSISLCTIMSRLLFKLDPKFRNISNLSHLINTYLSNPDGVNQLMSRYADDLLFEEYAAFSKFDDKLRLNVIASLKASLGLTQDEEIRKVTSQHTINFSELRTEKVVIYINNSISDLEFYRPLTSIFFNQLFSEVMREIPKKDDKYIFFLIDEASSIVIPGLDTVLANIRKHKAGICLGIQSLSQLENLYGRVKADAIVSNCFTKIYFPGQGQETSRMLEELCGTVEITDDKERKRVVPLIDRTSVRMLPKNHALVIAGNLHPILAKMNPYYNSRWYSKLMCEKAFPKTETVTLTEPELIDMKVQNKM